MGEPLAVRQPLAAVSWPQSFGAVPPLTCRVPRPSNYRQPEAPPIPPHSFQEIAFGPCPLSSNLVRLSWSGQKSADCLCASTEAPPPPRASRRADLRTPARDRGGSRTPAGGFHPPLAAATHYRLHQHHPLPVC